MRKLCIGNDLDFFVLQLALTENSRKGIGDPDLSLHKYPYKLLSNRSFEQTSIVERYRKTIREVEKFEANVVIIPGYYDMSMWGVTFYARLKGVKIIQCVDSTYHDAHRTRVKEKLKSFILKKADLIYCYGRAQENYLTKLSIQQSKIHKRVQATDSKRIEEKCYGDIVEKPSGLPSKYFLFVGRLSREKNVLGLIRAYLQVNTEWGLVIVGEGDDKSMLQYEASLSDEHNVIFTGGMNWEEVVLYYKYAAAFVLPSISEPWGLVVNEAMICGLPVLVSTHCGCSLDLVEEDKNGYVFSPSDVDELSDLLEKMTLLSGERLEQMGHHSRLINSKYTPEKAAQDMLNGLLKLQNG